MSYNCMVVRQLGNPKISLVEHYGSGLRFAMSCGESQGEDKSVKFCDFRLTEGNCLCDSSGWTRLDDAITHDIF